MLLWFAFALLTAAVLAWVLAPLARPEPAGATEPSADAAGLRAVYRDQLAEIEAERAQGLIGATEADAAKLEISRRLLAAAAWPQAATVSPGPGSPGPGSPGPGKFSGVRHANVALAAVIAVPLLTLGLYLLYGSPGLSSGPLAARTQTDGDRALLARMIAKVEERLRETPGDGKGWEVIAPIYFKLGRYADSASAYANAASLQGESAKLLAGLAEASIFAHDGIVTDEARKAYEKLLRLEPGKAEPRFWLAMAKEQDGRLADALSDYRALLDEAPAEAPYRASLDLRIKEVAARLDRAPAAATPDPSAGPSAADVEAATKLTSEQRQQMVAGMVDGLAQRLKSNGKDLAGWLRLVNAYAVLGRREDARAALAEARRNFEGDTRALSDLSRLATTLGLGS